MQLAAACLAVVTLFASLAAQPLTTPVTWLIFVDDLHLDFRNTGRTRDLLRTIVSELGRDGDSFAIASSGPSRLALDPTTNRQDITAAIKSATGNALRYEDMQSPNAAAEVRYRAATTLATAQEILANARRLPDPKAMLFVSNGFNVVMSNANDELATLVTTAVESNVRIFAIQPHPTLDLDALVAAGPGWDAYLAARETFLRSISDGSGGFSIVNELIPQLRRIALTMR